jgi:predicted DNA-binding protein (MmcQ/YjbR family)
MNLDSLRSHCLSLPYANEKVQWEDHLLFTIGGKMFVVTSFEPGPNVATLKPEPEHRLELLEREGIEPAPYLARAGWISVRDWDVLRDSEWRDLVSESYRMVLGKLPKRLQARFALAPTAAANASSEQVSGRKPQTSNRGRDGTPATKSKAKKVADTRPRTKSSSSVKGRRVNAAPRKKRG